jgi:hypothetical protein
VRFEKIERLCQFKTVFGCSDSLNLTSLVGKAPQGADVTQPKVCFGPIFHEASLLGLKFQKIGLTNVRFGLFRYMYIIKQIRSLNHNTLILCCVHVEFVNGVKNCQY